MKNRSGIVSLVVMLTVGLIVAVLTVAILSTERQDLNLINSLQTEIQLRAARHDCQALSRSQLPSTLYQDITCAINPSGIKILQKNNLELKAKL